eukprot:4120909-Pleurochrysis_carterae.AAC.2
MTGALRQSDCKYMWHATQLRSRPSGTCRQRRERPRAGWCGDHLTTARRCFARRERLARDRCFAI